MWPLSFAPYLWANCDGQLMHINQNEVLFSIISNYYGGDGQTTMALPNLIGRTAMHSGRGPGLPNYPVAAIGGLPKVGLELGQIPEHNHDWNVELASGDNQSPSGAMQAGAFGKGASCSP